MSLRQLLILGASVLASALCGRAVALEAQGQYVQVAEIEIDPAQLEAYKAAVREHTETAIRGSERVVAKACSPDCSIQGPLPGAEDAVPFVRV